MIPVDVLIVILPITRLIVLNSMRASLVYSTSFCHVHIPCHRRVAVYVSFGGLRLHKNICGEVERGIVCRRGGVALTRAGCVAGLNETGGYCQLWFASGWGTSTSLSSFHASIANWSINGKTDEVVFHLSAVISIGSSQGREPRTGTKGSPNIESALGIV